LLAATRSPRTRLALVDSTPTYELQFDLREIVSAYQKAHKKLPEHTWERFDGNTKRRLMSQTWRSRGGWTPPRAVSGALDLLARVTRVW